MTTFIDFRYSRALAAALFAGQEKEESAIVLDLSRDNYLAFSNDHGATGVLATLHDGQVVAFTVEAAAGTVTLCDSAGAVVTMHDATGISGSVSRMVSQA